MGCIFKPEALSWEDIDGGRGELTLEAIRNFISEYCYRIREALQVIRDVITSITDTPTNAVEKLITQVEEAVAQAEPKHSRRKQRRERAALIERRYMVQIRHYERAHPFRRVYKPP